MTPSLNPAPQPSTALWRALSRRSARLVLALVLVTSGSMAHADVPKTFYDFGFHAGTFLPSRIRGVQFLVPGWGLRGSMPTPKGTFELSTYLGRGNGIDYKSASIDYRLDIDFLEELPAHFILGLHADFYSGRLRITQNVFASGWHYGGGVSLPIAGPFLLRTDFKYRYSPGNALEITVGLTYRLPASEGF